VRRNRGRPKEEESAAGRREAEKKRRTSIIQKKRGIVRRKPGEELRVWGGDRTWMDGLGKRLCGRRIQTGRGTVLFQRTKRGKEGLRTVWSMRKWRGRWDLRRIGERGEKR